MTTMVKTMKPDPKEVMGQLAAIQGDSSGGDSGDTTKRYNSFTALNGNHMKDVVNNLAPLAEEKNKIIDMNSMMEALDDYVDQCRNAKCGVPINFYLSFIDKRKVASLLLDKYVPDWNKDEEEDEKQNSKKAKTK